MSEPLIFEISSPGRVGYSLPVLDVPEQPISDLIPESYLRNQPPHLPELSEPDVIRHFTRLSTWNSSPRL